MSPPSPPLPNGHASQGTGIGDEVVCTRGQEPLSDQFSPIHPIVFELKGNQSGDQREIAAM